MKTCLPVFVLILVVAGCSTVDSRIARQRSAFELWPFDVQQKVQMGEVAVGFTPEQVRVALGEPSRTFTRVTSDGRSEVWAYRDRQPKVSVGVGVGVGVARGASVYGGGIGLGGRDYHDDETTRVIFSGGASVRSRKP